MSFNGIPAVALSVQGAINTVFGLFGLVRPLDWRTQLATQFGGEITEPTGYATSLQLLSMGILTLILATESTLHRKTLFTRMCLHLMAAYFFLQDVKTKSAAMADLTFAAVNAVVLAIA